MLGSKAHVQHRAPRRKKTVAFFRSLVRKCFLSCAVHITINVIEKCINIAVNSNWMGYRLFKCPNWRLDLRQWMVRSGYCSDSKRKQKVNWNCIDLRKNTNAIMRFLVWIIEYLHSMNLNELVYLLNMVHKSSGPYWVACIKFNQHAWNNYSLPM